MDSNEKKIKSVMVETLKEIVLPKLDKIEKKQKDHDVKFEKIEQKLDATMEMTANNSEEITLLRDDFNDMGYVVERIETKLDATIRRQDDASVKSSQLARRVLKLEAKKS